MKRRRALLLTVTAVLVLCGACGAWLHKERQQYERNQQLLRALRKLDTAAMLALVKEGADPNTCAKPTPAPSLRQLLQQLLRHAPPPDNDAPSVFLVVCGDNSVLQHSSHGPDILVEESLPLLEAMLAHGANVNARGTNSSTALYQAVSYGRLHMAELLLAHGANVNAPDEGGQTPLMLAVVNDEANIAHLLLAHGANPNVPNAEGNTALHYVIGLPVAAELIPDLLAHGADPNLPNKQGDTPLKMAQQKHRPDIARLLMRSAK